MRIIRDGYEKEVIAVKVQAADKARASGERARSYRKRVHAEICPSYYTYCYMKEAGATRRRKIARKMIVHARSAIDCSCLHDIHEIK